MREDKQYRRRSVTGIERGEEESHRTENRIILDIDYKGVPLEIRENANHLEARLKRSPIEASWDRG
jgi:hypothetical protein